MVSIKKSYWNIIPLIKPVSFFALPVMRNGTNMRTREQPMINKSTENLLADAL
jgi:hypothetical protein